VEPLPAGSLEKLLSLRGVTFEWKNPKEYNKKTGEQIGLIAQEVEQIFPEWVQDNHQGFKAINYRGFEAIVVEAIKELDSHFEQPLNDQHQQLYEQRAQFEDLKANYEEMLGDSL